MMLIVLVLLLEIFFCLFSRLSPVRASCASVPFFSLNNFSAWWLLVKSAAFLAI
jgi:hypothetical protein